MNGKLKLTT